MKRTLHGPIRDFVILTAQEIPSKKEVEFIAFSDHFGAEQFLRRLISDDANMKIQSYSYPVPQQVNFLNDETVQIFCQDGIHTSKFTVSFDNRTLNTDRTLEFYKGKVYE